MRRQTQVPEPAHCPIDLLIPIARPKFTICPPSFRFPPLREGNRKKRAYSVPPARRGNLKEGVINCCFL
jgi:hypothetical protein